jgi:hypothetical protein
LQTNGAGTWREQENKKKDQSSVGGGSTSTDKDDLSRVEPAFVGKTGTEVACSPQFWSSIQGI